MVHYYKQKNYICACEHAGLTRLEGHDREQFVLLADYVKKHASALWYVHAVETGGRDIARILFSHAQTTFTPAIHAVLEALIEQLVHDKTMLLLPRVLSALAEMIDDQQGIVRAKIFISHSLSHDQADGIVEYFSWLLKKQVVPEFVIESDLIAGLRFEAVDLLWEDSARQRLRAISVHMQG